MAINVAKSHPWHPMAQLDLWLTSQIPDAPECAVQSNCWATV